MTRREAIALRYIIEQAAENLDDQTAIVGAVLFPAWSPTSTYEVGERVRYEGMLYRCLTAHTAQESWTPTAAPSIWAKVLIPGEPEIPDWQQPDSTNAYQIGDKVKHNGKIWISDLDNNVWEPGVYGWTEETNNN